ncbi:MAG TPA: hypothetical protein VNJ02_11020 [Vicinamibacterales bacterium]|nr:hypothetical protein [Vicinamibacterales bacterium]
MTMFTTLLLAALLGNAVSFGDAATQTAAPQPASKDAVSVTVDYKGKGPVDAKHQLWIWAFDTPDIGPGSIPIGELTLAKNGGTVTFPGVEKVWLAVAYDEAGGFTGQAPPPAGSPIAIYGSENGGPGKPLTASATPTVVTFDDSFRMP